MKIKKELANLINRHGIDTDLDTPDFLIADMILGFLSSIKECHAKHEQWADRENDRKDSTEGVTK